MKIDYNKIKDDLCKYESIGSAVSSNGACLIGHVPHVAPFAYLHILFPVIDFNEIDQLNNQLKVKIPRVYETFLTEFSNGLSLFSSSIELYGLRTDYSRSVDIRQPFDIINVNQYEHAQYHANNNIIIGSYSWDGSKISINCNTLKLTRFDRDTLEIYNEWESFDQFLLIELERLGQIFNLDGTKKVNDTTPIL